MKIIIGFLSLLTTLILLNPNQLRSQDFLGVIHDNYSGATGMFYQPANIVDSRYKFDMEFVGFSTRIENNWWGIDRNIIFNVNSWQDSGFASKYLSTIESPDAKNVHQNFEARVLSFMVSLSPKSALGINIRARQIINFNNLEYDAANLIMSSNNVSPLLGSSLDYQDMSQQAAAWAEYGLTYARVILNHKKHFLKAGITPKLLQGMGAMYLYEKNMSYNYINEDSAANVKADIRFGASSNFEDILNYKFVANPVIGLDFGFVYEYRPKYESMLYDMDNQKGLERQDLNKYLLKVSFSVLDLGSMKFKKEFGSNDFLVDETLMSFDVLDAGSVAELADSVIHNYQVVGSDPYFKFRLPTTINLNVDYNIFKSFYINVAGLYALNQGFNYISKVHYLNSLSVTPRFEGKMFGIGIPVRYSQFKETSVGLGVRLGPLWFGSNNLLGITGLQNTITAVDFYVALKIPIKYKAPQDQDLDKVSDAKDECPMQPGPFDLKGCPDSDGDGIPNKLDDCAYTPGKAEFSGCPDTDNDGVQDKFDECVDQAGSKLFAGCPDTDGDQIIDKNDSCVTLAGLAQFNGCPDSDGDSVPDNLDDCPSKAGLADFKGCPDTDGDKIIDPLDLCPDIAGEDSLQGCPYIDTDKDGLQDKYDQCPKIQGPIANKGCPYTDSDNDSVIDINDLCPMTPGTVANNGCPEIAQEEQEILNTAFNNLEFETAKATILGSSFSALNELATLLIKKTDYRLLIAGHTDNVGSNIINMELSQTRALAVKKYLMDKGVNPSQIDAKWYGETKPIADNETLEGRSKNRRVEMSVIFD